MATITVTTAADRIASDGVRSLREAVTLANATSGTDQIVFLSSLEGRTLTLTQGELVLSQDVTIDGDQNNDGTEVTLSGGDRSRILHIIGGQTDVSLRDLGLTHGHVANGNGGAIYSGGHQLQMTGCTISDCTIDGSQTENGGGGGIFAAADTRLTLTGCAIRNCTVDEETALGGGIYAADNTRVLVDNSSISGNSAYFYGQGAGIFAGGNIIVRNSIIDSNQKGAGIFLGLRSALDLYHSVVKNNDGGVSLGFGDYTTTNIQSSSITNNERYGLLSLTRYGNFVINDSTIADNAGAGISLFGPGVVRESTITGNLSGGINLISASRLDIADTIVAGNSGPDPNADISGTIYHSNGHNIFGSDVAGAIIGDLQGISPSRLFAAIDPNTGGGQLNTAGIVPLRNSFDNPALSGGDLLAALSIDQRGTARPLPADSLPDIGAAERNQVLADHLSPNNDVFTDTDAAHILFGQGGSDLIRGQGGNDQLFGEAGSDVLDGGAGNDLLDGGAGIDLARFGGTTAVAVDLIAGTATRGAETDTLSSIQGAIGSSTADTFRGDGGPNWFQGGGGRDVATAGAARDLYDYDHTSDSLPGVANRDVITDFAHGSDKIDLTGIDANGLVAGNQAFAWLGDAPLTGAGQANFITSGGNTIVQASTDADATPELQIRLTGSIPLSEGDFFL